MSAKLPMPWPRECLVGAISLRPAGCRMRTESLGRAFTAPRETDFGRQRRRAPIRFRTVFVSRRDRERAITPAPNRGKSRVFRGDGELGVSAGLRGGAGRTRTSHQTVMSDRL